MGPSSPRTRVLCLARLLLAVTLGAPAAHGAEPPAPTKATDGRPVRHRFTLAPMLGMSHLSISVNGYEQETQPDGMTAQFGFLFTFDERIVPAYSLGLRAGVYVMPSEPWSHRITMYDLGLQPKLWITPLRGRGVDFYAGLFGGLSVPAIETPERVAFDEHSSAASSYHFGLSVGGVYPRRSRTLVAPGFSFEAGYAAHRARVDERLVSEEAEHAGGEEAWSYEEGMFYVSFGFTLGVGSL
jgi:hypothetical protein